MIDWIIAECSPSDNTNHPGMSFTFRVQAVAPSDGKAKEKPLNGSGRSAAWRVPWSSPARCMPMSQFQFIRFIHRHTGTTHECWKCSQFVEGTATGRDTIRISNDYYCRLIATALRYRINKFKIFAEGCDNTASKHVALNCSQRAITNPNGWVNGVADCSTDLKSTIKYANGTTDIRLRAGARGCPNRLYSLPPWVGNSWSANLGRTLELCGSPNGK